MAKLNTEVDIECIYQLSDAEGKAAVKLMSGSHR
jgi:hypothetical protein